MPTTNTLKLFCHPFVLLCFFSFGTEVHASADKIDKKQTEEAKDASGSSFLGSMFGKITGQDEKTQELPENLPQPSRPEPFDIEYKVSLNALPTGLKATAKLRKQDEHYLFELHAQNWVLSYFEKSAFIWRNDQPCSLLTESYQFTFEGFGHTEAFEVHIDQAQQMAHSKTMKGNFDYSVPGNVSDALAYLFKLQCDVAHQRFNPDYQIAYDNGIDRYKFKYRGQEKLRTSMGKLDTLVLERIYKDDKFETTYWIAPALNYTLVRMRHKQGKMVTATLKIKDINYKLASPEEEEEKELEE